MKRSAKVLTVLGAALALGSATQASAGTLSPTLLQRARAGDQTQVGVIVRFNVANTPQGRALFKDLRVQLSGQLSKLGPTAGFLQSALNSGRATQLWLDQSIYVPLTPVQARAISLLPFVSEVFENFKVQIPKAVALSDSSSPAGTPWYLDKIGAPQAWAAGFKGQNIRIGHLDSGIDASHPDLAGKVAAFAEFNAAGDRVQNAQPHDTTDHGTHTAGLLVGSKTGVAPDAKVISALVLPNNEGTFAQVIAGMQYVLDPDNNADTNDGANVVNMSLGIPGTFDEFIVPVQNMLKAGVVPVFAIGNFGPNSATTGSPGNLPDAIGVGAVGQDGQVASFSSRGPVAWQGKINGVFVKPDIAAPGVEITSTYPGGKYGAKSGSSQASPIAAGAVALLLSAKPGTGVDAIKNALYTSASNASAKNNNTGYGLISVPGALGKLGVSVGGSGSGTTPTPTPTPAAQPTGPDGYTLCAVEGGTCTNVANKAVAFGTAGKYVFGTNDSSNTLLCTVQEWGNNDPAPGVTKGCFVKNSASTSTPTPTPTPTTGTGNSGQKPRVLLVDADRGQGADVTAALRDAVKANAASGGAFVWNVQSQGAVPLSEMKKADIVVWATGESYQNTIPANDQATLRQYLQGGGHLLVTGQDVGYDIGSSDFYTGVLGTRFVADSSGQTKFVTKGAFGNTAFTLNASGSAANQYYPDVLANTGSGQVVAGWGSANANASTITAQSIRVDPNRQRAAQKVQDPRGLVEGLARTVVSGLLNQILGGNTQAQAQNRPRVRAQSAGEDAGAIVVNAAGAYRTVNMGFGMEGLTPNSRNLLMKTSFDWLMR